MAKIKIDQVREEIGSVVFKAGKPQNGDVVIREKRRTKPKGKTISVAAKMKAAYKSRMAAKSKKK